MFGNAGLYAKALFAALMAGLTALYMGLDGAGDWNLSDREWVNIILAAVTAFGVWAFPNVAAPVAAKVSAAKKK